MTYKEAQANILKALQGQGWTVSQGLKIEHATKEGLRLWFKAQSIYFSHGNDFKAARSLHLGNNILKQLGAHQNASQIEAYLMRQVKDLS